MNGHSRNFNATITCDGYPASVLFGAMEGTSEDTDHELLTRWREGDALAGNRLFERHFDAVFRFFHFKCRDAARDLTQKTFMGCVRSAESFRGEASFRSFLFGIARNVLLRELRDRARAPKVDFEITSMVDLELSPTQVMARRAEKRLILRALRCVPVHDQILLEMYYWESFTGPELARIFEVPQTTLRARLRRAIKRLRAAVVSEAESPDLGHSVSADLESWVREVRELDSSLATPPQAVRGASD